MITHNVVPPSYKLVYKPHEYYSYVRTINHSYWSYLHQLNYHSGAPLCSVHLISQSKGDGIVASCGFNPIRNGDDLGWCVYGGLPNYLLVRFTQGIFGNDPFHHYQ